MSTDVVYNGVTISNCQTTMFDEQAIYDASDTDLLYHKFTVGVVGYIHLIANCQTVNISTNLPRSTALNEVAARTLLMEPRKQFTMTVFGYILLNVSPPTNSKYPPWGDVNNGPKPKAFKIEQIVGNALMKVYFEIELAVVECTSNANGTGVLNNRWSLRTSKDGNFYTTRVVTGRVRTASVGVTPDAFANFVFPPLLKGYRREEIETTTSADGLLIDYVITDKERYASPPSKKATSWEATVTTTSDQAQVVRDEVHVKIEGPKDADKMEMLVDAIMIAQQKADIDKPTSLIEQGAIIDHLDSNMIELRVLVLRNSATDNKLSLLNLPTKNLGKVIKKDGYDKDVWRLPSSYKSETPTGALVAFLQSPCDGAHNIPTDKAVKKQEKDEDRNTDVKTYTYTQPPPVDPSLSTIYSSDARRAVYMFYDLESEYLNKTNMIQLPVAASSNSSDPTSVFVQMAPPTGRRRIKVHAQRMGAPPLLPKPDTIKLNGSPAQLIKDLVIHPVAPIRTANGTVVQYEAHMEFTAAFARAPDIGVDKLSIGAVPWGTLSVDQTAMSPDDFVEGIV